MLHRLKAPKTNSAILNFFIAEETRSSALLLLAAAAGLFAANSLLATAYFDFLHYSIQIGGVTLDTQHWINEALMAIFFLVVGLEIKRELIDGELRGWKRASFPVYAAIGGMLVPAMLYALLNQNPPENQGWAIPMATDIAIAIGILGLLGRRIPRSVRVFLLTLAIVDDIGSIAVIAFFYSQPTSVLALLFALIVILIMAIVRNKRYWPVAFLGLGALLVYLLISAGISGTIGGIVIAALMPLTRSSYNNEQLQISEKIEDALLPLSSYFIVPLFVFANVGLVFSDLSLSNPQELSVFLGVALGLLIGKPLGIYLACRIAVSLQLTERPKGISWRSIQGVGFLAGIGFTISLLITNLAFDANPTLQNAATFGIFVASILAATIGGLLLRNSHMHRN